MEAMLNWLWQGGVIGLAALVMLRALERARANVRYTVCWAAMLAIVLLPIVPMATLSFAPAAIDGGLRVLPPTGDAILPLPAAWWTSTLVIAAAWVLWAVIQAVRFVRAIAAVRRVRACSQPFPLDLELTLPNWRRVQRRGRPARLVMSGAVGSAAVLGWGRPRIAVAPAVVHALNAADLDRILVHEWAHVQRRDDLQQLLQVAARIVAGWHPAFWVLERRLQVEREIACDETAVAVTGSAKSYAQCLLTLSARRPARTMAMAPAALMPSALHARVVKILSPYPAIAPVWARSIGVSIVGVLCLVSLNVSGVNLVGAETLALPIASAPAHLVARDTRVRPAPSGPREAARVNRATSPMSGARRDGSASAVAQALRRPRTDANAGVVAQTLSGPRNDTTPGGLAIGVERTLSGPREDARASTPTDSQSTPLTTVDAPPAPVLTVPAADAGTTLATTTTDLDGTPLPQSTAAAEKPPTLWGAAAAGGVIVGRKSRDASVATAGFFSRVAKRVAGSL